MFHRSKAILLAVLPVALLFSGCGSSDSSSSGAPAQFAAVIPTVEVVRARYGSLPLEERMSGIVRAENQVEIVAEISAPIVRIGVENGDYVEAGTPLVYLRDKQYQDQVNQSEAALQIAQADAQRTRASLTEAQNQMERMEQLASRQLESQQQLDAARANLAGAEAAQAQAEARISQAEANLEEQREQLRRAVVRAPISGYVGQRNAEVGMRVAPGTPLFTMGNFDRVRVEVSVTDRMINRINVGQTALITIEGSDEAPVEAEVSRISPFLNAESYSAQAQIDVDNTSRVLRPGMFVAVDVLYGESQSAVIVPEAVLYENQANGMLGVYVAPALSSETPVEEPDTYDPDNPSPITEATQLTFQPIEVLARGRGVAAVAGISMGDWVVSVGQNLVRPVNGTIQARTRPQSWDRILGLQNMMDQDLLAEFMEKQQRMAREKFDNQQRPSINQAPQTDEMAAEAPSEPVVKAGSTESSSDE
jgi:RND family efflux transporter MFP subunit